MSQSEEKGYPQSVQDSVREQLPANHLSTVEYNGNNYVLFNDEIVDVNAEGDDPIATVGSADEYRVIDGSYEARISNLVSLTERYAFASNKVAACVQAVDILSNSDHANNVTNEEFNNRISGIITEAYGHKGDDWFRQHVMNTMSDQTGLPPEMLGMVADVDEIVAQAKEQYGLN